MTYAKSFALAAALLASTASFAAHLPEGSYPQTEEAIAQGPSRAVVAAEAARHNAAGQPGQIKGEDRPQLVQSYDQQHLSRSQVVADRDAFAQSGQERIGNEA